MTTYRPFLVLLCLLALILPATALPVNPSNLVLLSDPARASDATEADRFGEFAAADGDTFAIGASQSRRQSGASDGAVYVYVRSGNEWIEQAALRKADNLFGASFAQKLDISGDTVVVAAPGDAPPGSNHTGAVYVFVRQLGIWSQQARLILSDRTSRLATGIAVEGDTLFVGREPSPFGQGQVDVYRRNGAVWTPGERLQPVHHSTGDSFGTAIAAEDDTVVIGAGNGNGEVAERTGAAFVFALSDGSWGEQTRLLAPDGATADGFGAAVATDGETVLVGASNHGYAGLTKSGAVYVYRREGEVWTFEAKLMPSDPRSELAFGGSVGISGDVAVVGARGQGTTGAAYIFRRERGAWHEVAQYRPLDETGGGAFGVGTATNGIWGVVGRHDRSYKPGEAFFVRMPPPAPGDVTAQAVSASEVRVTWAPASATEDGFEIWRQTGANGTYGVVGAVGAGAASYLDGGLAATTTYSYQVRAFNSGGASVFAGPASATTSGAGAVLNPPSGLTARALSTRAIRLTWIDQSTDELDFQLQRSLDGESFSDVEILPPDTASYTDDNDEAGLAPGTRYYFRLRARGAAGPSPFTPITWSTTLPDPPAAPGGLEARVVSATRVELTWRDLSTNEAGFRIERKAGEPDGPASYALVAEAGVGATSLSDTGLEPASRFTYRVTAFNRGGESSPSEPATAQTWPLPPPAPTGLTASEVAQTALTLTWSDASNREIGFEVERRSGAVGAFTRIASVEANGTSYRNSGLEPGSTYTYRVRALGLSGASDYSSLLDIATLPTPPLSPGDLAVVVVSQANVSLMWSDNSADELGFTLERRIGNAAFAPFRSLPANSETFLDSGLQPNTEYGYRLRAFNAGGNSIYSNRAAATTLPSTPPAPENLTATALSVSEVGLTWTDRSNNETGFKIERRKGSGAFETIAALGAGVVAYQDSGLTPATLYGYRVRATNAGGDSAPAGPVEVTLRPFPPGAPNDLAATVVSQSQIILAWSDNSSNETGFEVQRSREGGAFEVLTMLPAERETTTDTGLVANTSYTYRVVALNGGGRSSYSNRATAVTLPTAPQAPAQLVAEALSSTEIRLAWEDRSLNEAGFRIERREALSSPPSPFQIVGVAGAGVTAFGDTGLRPARIYVYRVQAFNAGGNSTYAGEVGGETLPEAPAAPNDLHVEAAGPTTLVLTWSDNSDSETGFEIERRLGGIADPGSFVRVATESWNVDRFIDDNVQPDTTYTYRIRAVNPGGASAYTSRASGATPPLPPAAPTAFTAAALSTAALRLSWTDPSNNEEGFRLYRWRAGVIEGVLVATLSANVTHFDDTGLAPRTRYQYQLQAFNRGGASDPAFTAGTTFALGTPLALTVTVQNGGKARLQWKDNSNGETGYQIERKVGNGNFQLLRTVPSRTKSHLDTRLTLGQSYAYRVRATGSGGDLSGYSNEVSVLIPLRKRLLHR